MRYHAPPSVIQSMREKLSAITSILRNNAGLSQDELAEKVYVTRQAV